MSVMPWVWQSLWLMAVASLMALAYMGLALGNEWLLASTEYGKGVNWVYVPAGLRLTFVLIMPWAGAIAISIGSFAMALRDPDLNIFKMSSRSMAWASARRNGLPTSCPNSGRR